MAFSQKIKQEIFVLCARHCCVCRKSKGIKLEVHHIKPQKDSGEDTLENAIALCFDCHADAGHYFAGHPKGSKFSPVELLRHKEEWFKIVKQNKIHATTESFAGNNVERLKHSLKMEKKVFKNLIDHKSIKENKDMGYYLYNPSHMFVSLKIIIRNVDKDIYPQYDDSNSREISSWFKTFIYSTYHRGIEVWLNPGQTDKVIMDENGSWEVLKDRYDPRTTDSRYIVFNSKMIGQIPYSTIVDLKIGGDEYTSEPHIFCKFEFEGEPYEVIYYKSFGNPERQIPDITLDKDKQTVFVS